MARFIWMGPGPDPQRRGRCSGCLQVRAVFRADVRRGIKLCFRCLLFIVSHTIVEPEERTAA